MIVNVTYMKMEMEREGSICLYLINKEMEAKYAAQGFDYTPPIVFYLGDDDKKHLVDRLFGRPTPNFYLADAYQYLGATQTGLHYIHPQGANSCEQWWFTFPGHHLAGNLIHITEPGHVFEILASTWEAIGRAVAPVVEWDISPEVQAKLDEDKVDPRAPKLTDLLDSLERIAANHSNGKPAKVHIRFDHKPREGEPNSYYFLITDEKENRVINGGIIAHPNYDGFTTYDGKEFFADEEVAYLCPNYPHHIEAHPDLKHTGLQVKTPGDHYLTMVKHHPSGTWKYQTHT
jgi:hypothetical protein